MMYRVLLPMLVAALLCATGGCQFHPRPLDALGEAPPPIQITPLPYEVSTMHVQTVRSTTYLYSSTRTSFNDLCESGASHSIAALLQARGPDAARPESTPSKGILLIFHDLTEDPAAQLDVEIGLPVSDNTPPTGDLQVRKLPPFHCAKLVYRGALKHLRIAYDKLIPEMIAAGYIPSDETRESYQVWEGADSPNNVVEIAVGIR